MGAALLAATLVGAAVAVVMSPHTRPRGDGPVAIVRRVAALVAARRGGRHRRAAAARGAASRWVDAVAAEVRAGRPPRTAVLTAAESVGSGPVPCPRAVAAAALGGDVAAALRADARAAGLSALHLAAACWSVAEGSGSGLAPALDQVVEAARAEEEVRAEITAQLAAPRATARLLAVLPLVGLLLGSSLGASPVAWLTGSPIGLVVLVLGVGEIVLGLWWTSAMVSAVERRLAVPGLIPR